MALAKRDVRKSKALSKADTDPKDDDEDEKKKKEAADAAAAASAKADDVAKADDSDDDEDSDEDDMEKAEDDDEGDDTDEDEDEDDDYDDEGDDDMPIGEFRVEVMPNGMVRIHKDDLTDDDEDEDEDDSDDSDDAQDTDPPLSTNTDQEDVTMGKSASARSAPTATSVAVTEESLTKALQTLMGVAKASEGPASLMKRAQSKEGITKSEAKRLLGRSKRGNASLGDSVAKSFTEDAQLSKAHGSQDSDVGEYLEALTERTAKSSAMLADSMESSVQQLTAQTERYHSVMAKAVGQSLAALKLISERMGVIEAQPTRAPKSLSAMPVEAAQKSFGGAIPSESLSKAEMLDTLTRMNLDSMKSGRQGMSKGHRPLMNGIEAAMNDQSPDAGLLEEVKAFRLASA